MIKSLQIIITIFFMSSCSILGINTEKGPKYEVLLKESEFEIRKYSAYIVAQTEVKGNLEESQNKAFKILANYIFGKNETRNKIPMTSPVITKESENIDMTAPVTLFENGEYTVMQFTMPKEYTLKTLPIPKNDKVELKKIPSKTVAVIRYTWSDNQEKRDENYKKLRSWINSQEKYKSYSDPYYAGYNPPWTIPFLRRNEVLIPIKSK